MFEKSSEVNTFLGNREVGNAILNTKGKAFLPLFQYATHIWVSTNCCSLICLSWSYNSQVTPVCLLHSEKIGKRVFLYVFNMVFPTSPLKKTKEKKKKSKEIGHYVTTAGGDSAQLNSAWGAWHWVDSSLALVHSQRMKLIQTLEILCVKKKCLQCGHCFNWVDKILMINLSKLYVWHTYLLLWVIILIICYS